MTNTFRKIECNSAEELWERLAPTNPLVKEPSNFLYRGHSNADWKLLPKVLRSPPDIPLSYVDLLLNKKRPHYADAQVFAELLIARSFVIACDDSGLAIPSGSISARKSLLSIDPKDIDQFFNQPTRWPADEYFELLALMQHNGVPTRLLDWTRRSYVAAYFAASDAIGKIISGQSDIRHMAIWALDIETINRWEDIFVVQVPGQTSPNLAAQKGMFTLHREITSQTATYSPTPLEKRFTSKNTPLWKITLPVTEAKSLLNLCHKYDISGATLFPGYDGAARKVFDVICGNC